VSPLPRRLILAAVPPYLSFTRIALVIHVLSSFLFLVHDPVAQWLVGRVAACCGHMQTCLFVPRQWLIDVEVNTSSWLGGIVA
jgi:hypothetical protein